VNITLTVVVVALAWSVLSIIVALTVGGMAKARDAGATRRFDQNLTTGPMAPPVRDEGVRPAV
jgi:hypothetical protein